MGYKRNIMKRAVIMLPVFLAVSLAGCSRSKAPEESPQEDSRDSQEDLQSAEEHYGEETDLDSNIREVGTIKTYFEEIYSEKDPDRLLVSIDLKWLQVDERFAGADKINEYLTECQEQNIALMKGDMEWLTDDVEEEFFSAIFCSYESELTELSYLDERYLSFCQSEYEYSGGAHGMPYRIGYTFDLETGERLTLADVIENNEEELKDTVTGYFEELIAEDPDIYWDGALDVVREGTDLDSSFYLTEEGIVFYFYPYELASYADGFQAVNIPYHEFAMKIALENIQEQDAPEKADRPAAIEKAAPEGGKLILASEDWGLSFGESGTQPVGNASAPNLAWYDAYYVGSDSDKVLYLTFDCGYENGNTEPILDALKKHNAKGTFFVVGHFLETAPELVKRMVEEGHAVGNHTYHHPDMSSISDLESFQKEMDGVADLFYEITGTELSPYYRPPQGKCNARNLEMAQELGYCTIFWSLAHVDWNQDAQPGEQESISKLTSRVHPGAIVLLHNTSSTNGKILDELLTKWEEMGYSFRPLSDLTGK